MSTDEDQSEPNTRRLEQLIEDTRSEIANARKFLDQLRSESRSRQHIERIVADLEHRLAELHARARHSTP